MTMTLHKRIALAYKIPRITSLIDEDIKLIKKLNTVLGKLEKTNKDQYVLESINILRSLGNVFLFEELYVILYELVDMKYHSTINYLIEVIEENVDVENKRTKIVKKLQDITSNEC